MKPKILIVDDEIENIDLIKDYLEDIDADTIEAMDGIEAMEILKKSHEEIDLILLDRMMPKMNGMEVMAEIKKHSKMSKIPVIMQTAAKAPEEIKEGFLAGVFYYLLKPYKDETLISLVNAALERYKEDTATRRELSKYTHMLDLMANCQLSFQSLTDVRDLSTLIASFFPKPDDIVIGIRELLINAIEHGNLGLSYDEKSKFLEKNEWNTEIERRSKLPENKDKKAKISYLKTDSKITLIVKDEGSGFNWQKRLKLSSDVLNQTHGRGIPMCKHLFFDELKYVGTGNEVHASILL